MHSQAELSPDFLVLGCPMLVADTPTRNTIQAPITIVCMEDHVGIHFSLCGNLGSPRDPRATRYLCILNLVAPILLAFDRIITDPPFTS